MNHRRQDAEFAGHIAGEFITHARAAVGEINTQGGRQHLAPQVVADADGSLDQARAGRQRDVRYEPAAAIPILPVIPHTHAGALAVFQVLHRRAAACRDRFAPVFERRVQIIPLT